jgi:hypothetical protein
VLCCTLPLFSRLPAGLASGGGVPALRRSSTDADFSHQTVRDTAEK